MLKIENLSFSYGEQKILEDISININSGEIVGLIGDNGSGKSTLMKLMCGLREPENGVIERKYQRIGALIEEPSLYGNMSVKENLEFFRVLYNQSKEKVIEVAELTGINSYLSKKINKLSVGMKRRVSIAVAVLSSEEMLLLDEPTNGLDPTGIRDILFLIKDLSEKKGTSFLISSHIFQNLESICDTYYKLDNTKLENIYDNDRVFGYKLIYQEINKAKIIELLDIYSCEYKIEKNKFFLKHSTISKELYQELKSCNIDLEKRNLSEVYYG